MEWMNLGSLLLAGVMGSDPASTAPATLAAPAPSPQTITTLAPSYVESTCSSCAWGNLDKPWFASDRDFEGFVGPLSNPIFSKDPRSNTELRALIIHNEISDESLLGGGNFTALALQARLHVTDRLQLFADKDGYAFIRPNAVLNNSEGFLNLAAGAKYLLVRDVENQFIVAAGAQYEIQTGEASVFQSNGSGLITGFLTIGKEFACKHHVIANAGYVQAVDTAENSSLIYTQLHLDTQIAGWIYPIYEVNWYHFTQGGRWIGPLGFEGDGLINIGTSGVAGNDLVTNAIGTKFVINKYLTTGVAYEFPLSNREDLVEGRFLGEMIIRY